MIDNRLTRTRRRAIVWSTIYAGIVVVSTSLMPLWVCWRPLSSGGGWYDEICFCHAVGRAIRDRDGTYLWSRDNRSSTLILLGLTIGAWPLVFGLAMWRRRPDDNPDYDDGPLAD
jgi:hypothetical protein